MSKIEKWIAGITLFTVVGGVLVQQFWYVPYYIESAVRAQVVAELNAADFNAVEDASDLNTATIAAVQAQLTGIENRMIARDALFMQYLQRQSSGGAGSSQ